MNALLCQRWTLPLLSGLTAYTSEQEKSYLRYVWAKAPLVSAKCWATEWLLRDVVAKSTCEYFAGAGITATIIQHVCGAEQLTLVENSEDCLKQLAYAFPGQRVVQSDARAFAATQRSDELAVLDFPRFTITQAQGRWRLPLKAIFDGAPKAVMVTDTSLSYFPVHRKLYGLKLNAGLTTHWDYCRAYSRWLREEVGYSVKRVAVRGTNAVYMLAVPDVYGDFEIKEFPVRKDCADGFVVSE